MRDVLQTFSGCNYLERSRSRIGPRMLASGKVNVMALIGSSRVADHLKKQHPKSDRLRAVLGLDAKNAAIVWRMVT